MAYTRQTWSNGASGGTPLSAARLNHIEEGIDTAADVADTAASDATAAAVAAVAAQTTADAALPKAGGTMTGELVADQGIANTHLQAVTADAAATVTDTTFTSTGLITTVTVGTSGRLKVTVAAEVRMTVGAGPVRIAADLDAAAAANARSAVADSTTWVTVERTTVLTGLTPGDHTVRLAALVTSGGDTAEARFRSIVAEPI